MWRVRGGVWRSIYLRSGSSFSSARVLGSGCSILITLCCGKLVLGDYVGCDPGTIDGIVGWGFFARGAG